MKDKHPFSKAAILGFFLAGFVCSSVWGQRTTSREKEKAIADIVAIASDIEGLPAKDVREDLEPVKLDASEELKAHLSGKIRASANLRIKSVTHWTDDASPFAVEFAGAGTVSLELPRKLVGDEDGNPTKVKRGKDVFFTTVVVQPALSTDPNELSYLFVEGAVIGFGLEPPTRGIRAGSVFILNGDAKDAELEDWVPAGISFPVNDDYQMAMPINLGLRIDPDAGEWDLYLMNKLLYGGIRYGKPLKGISARSAGSGTTRLAELAVYDGNPFFDDADLDGIEDHEEESLGFSTELNDRYVLDELGEFTNLQHFMNLRKVYRSRSEKELERTLVEAAALDELGQEASAGLKSLRIRDEQRTRTFTEEDLEENRTEAAARMKNFGRKAEDRSETGPGIQIGGKESE